MDIIKFFTKRQGLVEFDKQEGVQTAESSLNLDLDDAELIKVIDERIKKASPVKDQIDKINQKNEDYYLGKQIDETKLHNHQSKVVDNRLFLGIDTIVPILATKKRDPIVMPTQNTDESRELAQYAQEYLSWKWNEQKMNLKLANVVRFLNVYRIAILKYRFVVGSYNDYILEVKRPESIVIDNKLKPDFIGEYLKDTVQGILDKFALKEDGKYDKKKKDTILKSLNLTDKQLGTEVVYLEFWTPDLVVWKMKDVILDKSKNPNWIWDAKGKTFNHLLEREMPYVIFSWQNFLKGIYSDTTSLEQAKSLQDNINKRKRQISDNADQASGTWIFNEKYISKKEASKFIGSPNQHIMYNGDGTVNDAIGRLLPKDLGVQVFNDLLDDKAEVDNILGVHSTTRGERSGQKTATEASLLKQSDYGRLDLMSQYIDTKCEEIYNAFIQMSLVYYDEMKTLKILGADNSQKYIEFSRDNIEDGIEIIVRSEPLLAQAEEMEKYMAMFQAGLVDPLTMYERLNLPNPKELTRRKILLDADARAYLAQYAMDENSPGMEDDPVVMAKKDIQGLEKGEAVPPFGNVNRDHIKEHSKYMSSGKFKKLKREIQQLMVNHVRAEMEIMKQQVNQVKGQPMQ